jgi:histidine triad (HIT) family protein
MGSIFTKIVNGEIPCHKVAEDSKYFAFLDINPVAKGHTLVIPKKEVDYLFDLDAETLSGLTLFAQKAARGIAKAVPCKRVGVVVLGLEVPHAHVHLIPINSEADVDFKKPKLKMEQEEMAALAKKIQAAVGSEGK